MSATATRTEVAVDGLDVTAYEVPTDQPESDGTLAWDSTTVVVVEARAGDRTGTGYTYGPPAIGAYVEDKLAGVVCGADALKVPQAWARMQEASRNAGTSGIGAMAISAVDNALWDLAARLHDLPLVTLLGQVHDHANIYGSGGFTSYDHGGLAEQLRGWVEQGIPRVKMKVGREPERDRERVAWARDAIGPDVELMVDANGAYRLPEARAWARWFAEQDVVWLEEPVSSDDREGLRLLREQALPGLAIAAGEYAWTLFDLRDLVGCVDVLQPDVTRCGGITAFRRADGLAKAHGLPLSAHCAPAQTVHPLCACETGVHLEYFHDHVRIESLLFDGTLEPREGGRLVPDLTRAGNGLELKRADAEEYAL
jgi:L-alanine-DL-glutamate epimerase-like enolase superfamily enzyme